MFKNEKESFVEEAETVIAPSVRVEGDFVSEGNIRIEGAVSGSVATKQDLFVGSDAEIKAEVSARSGMIAGVLKGNLKISDRLELASTARIYGDIDAAVLSVEPGAVLQGQLTVGGGSVESTTQKVQKIEQPEEVVAEEPESTQETRARKIEEILQQ